MQNELINGRTPEQIKYGLRCGVNGEHECSTCEYYGRINEENGLREFDCGEIDRDALALIEHLEAERDAALAKVPRWISIRERLPQDGQRIVMINKKYPSITLQGIYKADETPDTIRVFGFGIGKVTHWMPLSEPPEVSE